SHHDKGAPLLIFPGNFPAEQQAEGLANTTPPPDNTRIAVQPVYARGSDRSSIVMLVVDVRLPRSAPRSPPDAPDPGRPDCDTLPGSADARRDDRCGNA